eukprot:GSA25T00025195001.1
MYRRELQLFDANGNPVPAQGADLTAVNSGISFSPMHEQDIGTGGAAVHASKIEPPPSRVEAS